MAQRTLGNIAALASTLCLMGCGEGEMMTVSDSSLGPDRAVHDGFVPGDAGTTPDAAADGLFGDALGRDAAPGEATATIVFPPASATTRDTIVVRGTTRGEVTSISVSSVRAESDDSFATWQVEVPLEDGMNALSVQIETASGGRSGPMVEVERRGASGFVRGEGETPGRPRQIVYDPLREVALITDGVPDLVWAVDLATGDRRLFPHLGHATTSPGEMVVDGDTLFLADGEVVVAVDLLTEEQSVFSGTPGPECSSCGPPTPPRGEGPRGAIRGLALHEGRLLVLMNGHGIVEIDRETGNRTLIHPGWERATSFAVLGDRAYLTPLRGRDLEGVNLVTDERFVMEESGPGNVHAFDSGLVIQSGLELFHVEEDGSLTPFPVDSSAPDPVIYAGVGAGPGFILALDHVPGYADPPQRDALIFAIDPVSGTRVVISTTEL